MSREEVYAILYKYDRPSYEYYSRNAAYLSVGAYWYAERLKQAHNGGRQDES